MRCFHACMSYTLNNRNDLWAVFENACVSMPALNCKHLRITHCKRHISNSSLYFSKGFVQRSVCRATVRYQVARAGHSPGEGGVCGYELQRPLSGAERPDSKRAHHIQQVPLRHHWSFWWYNTTRGEYGEHWNLIQFNTDRWTRIHQKLTPDTIE